MKNNLLEKLRRFLWAGFLISLPVTNFRYFPTFLSSGKVDVRPLLIFPLLPLLILYTIPGIWKRKLPRVWIPFLVFIVLIFVSSSLPVITGVSSQLGESSLTSRLIRTGVTLVLSASIYLTVSLMSRTEEDLEFTLKWLYAGMVIALFWGLLQIIFVLDLIPGWYQIMEDLQKHITMNVGSPDRLMGLTLEPSWFASQLTSLWLPWVLPAVLMDKTIYRKRWGWLTVEKVFLAVLLFVLVFTLSRTGLVVASVVIGFGVLFLRPKRDPEDHYFKHIKWIGDLQRTFGRISPPIRFIIISLGTVVSLAVVLYIASLQSNYIYRMWDYWLQILNKPGTNVDRSLADYFRYIGFGPRFVYWETAYRIFSQHPLIGVGLGNYTFHFQDMFPAVQVGYEPELLSRLVPGGARLVTAKNFLARLLAETGIIGTAAFVSYLVSLVGGGLYLWMSKVPKEKFWGAGALLAIIAFLVDSFSYDSLAIPNPWVSFGIITAAIAVHINKTTIVRGNE